MDYRLIIFAVLVVSAVTAKLGSRRFYGFVKPLPVLFIIFLAFLHPQPLYGLWLAAIGLGLAGDIILLSEKGFLPGLLSFLLGHIYYIFAFERGETPGGPIGAPVLVGVSVLCVGAFVYLARHLISGRRKKYIFPVFVYIAVTGVLMAVSLRNPIASFAVLGATSFAVSDFLLAFNKFVRPSWYAQAAVSLTYYGAQWLLARYFVGF
jgi:uncharacterized membrane protein YhhN